MIFPVASCKRVKTLYFCLWLSCIPICSSFASHIVGGEFAFVAKAGRGYSYTLSLNLYFDALHGNPKAEDAKILIAIYSRATHLRVDTFSLYKTTITPLSYTNPDCVPGNVGTKQIVYTCDLSLSPALYSDPAGYYIVWERCCRNAGIVNMEEPGSSGITFYLEFPAIVQAGAKFINSSPQFSMPVSEYGCVNEAFTLPFGATDADGDQLVYTLVTPYRGQSKENEPAPIPTPAPYAPITWATGFSTTNSMGGPQPLRIHRENGSLSFTTDKIGLYVFAMRCEEYRQGVKIGEVRRDYQIMVLDCQKNRTPAIHLKKNATSPLYQEGSVLTLTAGESHCLEVLATDVDLNSPLLISLQAKNFSSNYITLTPTAGTVTGTGDTLRSELCLDDCLVSEPGVPLRLDLIVTDDGCPIGKTDTLHLQLYVEPRPTMPPQVTTTLPANQAALQIGEQISFQVVGSDGDQDTIVVEAKGRGFDLKQAGMSFTKTVGKGTVSSPFTWIPTCTFPEGSVFQVDLIVQEIRCGKPVKSDTVTVTLTFIHKPNISPSIATTLPDNRAFLLPDSLIQFSVTATDPDEEIIHVRAEGQGFSLAEVGMRFSDPLEGKYKVSAAFTWQPSCASGEGEYMIDFIVEDNSCGPGRYDTVTVSLTLKDKVVDATSFLPPNVFTPNGDNVNEYFEMPTLPIDNCTNYFKRVDIYNRWGKRVFTTTNRNFRWAGTDCSTGTYFYSILYSKRQYKGVLSLLR